ncbi:N-acetylmuramoyl-L-alanine amidase [Marinilongibacter aquaticus]|uniref:N-acetylmuramoyl-L-alanine amidase n=1 Tax=Marinilongibacter aquaticus TaxID=2975157 RepID=UPI0021BDA47A|nr:peptidoglycan recognition family protein [Marinilongibacter aquaticus]UBM60688.1 N-acetylmuramoyl-L-alanine amidase [Marinilongibacter aquaticus]
MTKYTFLLFVVCCASCAPRLQIIDKPIEFGDERIKLTKAYMKEHYGIVQDNIEIEPKMVVVHWTAIPTFEGSFAAFEHTRLPESRTAIKGASPLNVSIQFLVDQNGKVYRLMPENWMARHVIGLNHAAIGIENVGGTKGTPLTKAQFRANVKLVKYLKRKYPIEYLLGHLEYTRFENSPLWKEKDGNYRTTKTDPGKDFMKNLRQKTRKLDFLPVP